MTDLRKLIEAVEGGVRLPMDGSAYRLFGDSWLDVFDAYHGSLDAAKALHEALLPGWLYHIGWSQGVPVMNATIWHPDQEWEEVDGTCENPARAWLLSILKAYEAQQ